MRSVKNRSPKLDQQARAPQQPLTEQPAQNARVRLLSPCEDLHTLIAKRAYEFYGARGYRDGGRSMIGLMRNVRFSVGIHRPDRAR